jgi:small subunit ribosomal protein S13
MARIAGVDLPKDKQMKIALTYVYGIGRTQALVILEKASIDATIKAKDLTEDKAKRIQEVIDKEMVCEGDLRKVLSMNVKRLKDIGSWRGLRHIKKLPARGQRTRTNSRTKRGNLRVTATSGRRKIEKT